MIFFIIALVAIALLCVRFPFVKCILLNLPLTIYYGVKDIFYFFHDFKYNDAEKTVGKMICYNGLFGKGKTLSLSHHIRGLFNRYDGKKVRKNGATRMQRVRVLSNITLNDIPYIEFKNLNDLVQITKTIADDDKQNNTYTVVYVLFDEAQNALYCRNYKTNLSSDVLSVLTQIRKLRCSVYLTSTRYSQLDCTLRQDCTYAVSCNKLWRLIVNTYYDAWDYENAVCLDDVKPLKRIVWFAKNSDFSAYDTYSLTEVISKDVMTGNVIPLEERMIDIEKKEPVHLTRKALKRKKA